MIVHFLKCVHYRRLFNNAGAPGELLQCANYVRGGDTVLDLGANIGIYSKHLSAMVGLSGQVHAVELMPETCSYLLGNVRDLGNVFCYNAGVSSTTGVSHACLPDRLPGGGGHIYRAHLAEAGIPVRIYRLDDLFGDLSPSFIKCDVEGNELNVILGAKLLISRCKPVWLIENKSDAVFSAMRDLGYEGRYLGHDWLFTPMTGLE